MAIGTAKLSPMEDYVRKLATADPGTALSIALSEVERQQAIAAARHEEYRALSEIEFDDKGRIAKATMGGLYRLAQFYAGSALVPKQYQGKVNDCFIACQMAARLRVDPFAYMQASYIVHGKPGIEAKLAIAMLNTSGKIKGRIHFKLEGAGKTRKCTASATDAETGEVVESTVDWAMVEAEGWSKKDGSKWLTIPDMMFCYRSATFLTRVYYPEVLMGMSLVDELEDIGPEPTSTKPAQNLDDLTNRLLGTDSPTDDAIEGEVTDKKESNDNGLKAGETMKTDGEIVKPDETTQLDPAEALAETLTAYKAELTAAKDLAACNTLEETYLRKVPEASWPEITGRADERREAIRATRGSKSNQKELVGAK